MRLAIEIVLALAFVLPVAADEFDDLVSLLAEQDYEKRRIAEELLQARVTARDIPRLESKLGDNYLVNSGVIRVIELVGGDAARDSLRKILQGENPTNALYAYYSLARLKDEWANEYVLALLADPATPEAKKQNFVNALYSIPNEKAIPVLRGILATSQNEYLRTRAIALLADRKDTASLEVLRALVADEKEKESVRGAAGVALVRLGDATGEDLVRSMIAAGKLQYSELSQLLASIQTKEKAEKYFDALREHLFASKEKHVRTTIIDFLGRMGDTKLLDRIDSLFDDPEEEVAEAAGRAVLALGRSPDQMKKYLADPAVRIRFKVEVAGALLAIDDFDGLAVLLAAVTNEDAVVRRSATEKLGLARIDEAVEPLLERLSDADTTVRSQAETSLRQTFEALLPYSSYDWEKLGYESGRPDVEKDRRAIQALSEWWRRNKEAAR